MNNNFFEYELANIKLRLVNLDDEERYFCNELLPPIFSYSVCSEQYTYVFHKKIDFIKESKTPIELINAKYYIYEDICYVNFKNGGIAIWDFLNKTFKYSVGVQYRNLRNWFFLNIIDPFSLACIERSKLVVHGSLWEYNGVGSIICGESGSGKSTLSFLAKNELTVHCDDCLVLSYEEETVMAYPIHSGFGIKREILHKYNIEINEKNILVKNRDKIYLKRFDKNHSLYACVPIRNIFILRKNCSHNTQVTKIQKPVAIKQFLNLQTNLPTTTFKEKYILIKSFLDKCNVFTVEYNNICDIDVVLNEVIKE